MTCGICRRSQEDGFRKFQCEGIDVAETCQTGEVPKLIEENQGFWELFLKILPGLFDGYGAPRFESIVAVFDVFGVKPGQRPVLMDKCLALIHVIKEIRDAGKQ